MVKFFPSFDFACLFPLQHTWQCFDYALQYGRRGEELYINPTPNVQFVNLSVHAKQWLPVEEPDWTGPLSDVGLGYDIGYQQLLLQDCPLSDSAGTDRKLSMAHARSSALHQQGRHSE